jgi:metal-responsive CopG/Arc/MetJ family transcriptional regulator
MIELQLSPEMTQKLEFVSKKRHTSPSALINEALKSFLLDKNIEEKNMEDSYEIGKAYFGNYGSGNSSLSTDYKKLLKGKLRAKIHTD